MLKYLILLVIGVAVGYGLGFQDAKQNDENVVARLVSAVGGSSREKVRTDVDATMDKLEDKNAPSKK
jgi:hypothetical protein